MANTKIELIEYFVSFKGSGTINANGAKIENGILTQTRGGSGTGTFSMTKQ